ncbi:hypothetical protein [Streptomyces sp. NPDC005262]
MPGVLSEGIAAVLEEPSGGVEHLDTVAAGSVQAVTVAAAH